MGPSLHVGELRTEHVNPVFCYLHVRVCVCVCVCVCVSMYALVMEELSYTRN
jgi:hypothetical protein